MANTVTVKDRYGNPIDFIVTSNENMTSDEAQVIVDSWCRT